MFTLIVKLLVLSSINSLTAGEILTEFQINDNRLDEPRGFPCPDAAEIAPCICTYDSSSQLTLDCTDISSDEELAHIFTHEFPVNDFYQFQMTSSSALTTLNFTCGGVKFRRFELNPGSFSLSDVSDIFYESCSNGDLEHVTLWDTELSSFPFPPPPLNDKIIDFIMPFCNLKSLPTIRSNSLSLLDLGYTLISQIIPGTFDEIPNLRSLKLHTSYIKILQSGSIPITSNAFEYLLYHNEIETIEAGAFTLKGEPPLNSLEIYLHENFLKTIDGTVFGLLMPYVNKLTIYDNPLDCGCDVAWIILNPEYLEKVTIDGDPTCADGTLLTDLDSSAFEQFC